MTRRDEITAERGAREHAIGVRRGQLAQLVSQRDNAQQGQRFTLDSQIIDEEVAIQNEFDKLLALSDELESLPP
jgi:hypothetical protein